MASIVPNTKVTLPSLRTPLIDSSPTSPPPPSNDKHITLTPLKDKSQHDQLYSPPSLPFPLSPQSAVYGDYRRCVSTCSVSSPPSLTYSPSPSSSPSSPLPPSPTRPAYPNSFLLVPCAFHMANAVVIIADESSTTEDCSLSGKSTSPPLTSASFRPCKPSEARAMLLVGPAISAHARKSAARGERRMYPYRIVRERRDSGVSRFTPAA